MESIVKLEPQFLFGPCTASIVCLVSSYLSVVCKIVSQVEGDKSQALVSYNGHSSLLIQLSKYGWPMYETSACGINMKCEFHHPNSLRTLEFGNLTNPPLLLEKTEHSINEQWRLDPWDMEESSCTLLYIQFPLPCAEVPKILKRLETLSLIEYFDPSLDSENLAQVMEFTIWVPGYHGMYQHILCVNCKSNEYDVWRNNDLMWRALSSTRTAWSWGMLIVCCSGVEKITDS